MTAAAMDEEEGETALNRKRTLSWETMNNNGQTNADYAILRTLYRTDKLVQSSR